MSKPVDIVICCLEAFAKRDCTLLSNAPCLYDLEMLTRSACLNFLKVVKRLVSRTFGDAFDTDLTLSLRKSRADLWIVAADVDEIATQSKRKHAKNPKGSMIVTCL